MCEYMFPAELPGHDPLEDSGCGCLQPQARLHGPSSRAFKHLFVQEPTISTSRSPLYNLRDIPQLGALESSRKGFELWEPEPMDMAPEFKTQTDFGPLQKSVA